MGPTPAHILAGQERVRQAGLCGELIADGEQMCIRQAGHAPPHGDAAGSLRILDKPALIRFQGGAVIIQAYGCGQCGHDFWIEENVPGEAPPVGSTLHCPRCGTAGLVPERKS